MIIDNKGKLFGKVSIVDLLIIVIIVAGLLGVYYKYGKTSSIGIISKTEKISLTFYIEDLAGYVADDIKAGDAVRDKASGGYIGKVTKVEIGNDITYYPNSEGKVVVSSKPGYASIKITVEGQGEYNSDNVKFNNVDYYVNKQFELRVGITNLYPRIIDIQRIEG